MTLLIQKPGAVSNSVIQLNEAAVYFIRRTILDNFFIIAPTPGSEIRDDKGLKVRQTSWL